MLKERQEQNFHKHALEQLVRFVSHTKNCFLGCAKVWFFFCHRCGIQVLL